MKLKGSDIEISGTRDRTTKRVANNITENNKTNLIKLSESINIVLSKTLPMFSYLAILISMYFFIGSKETAPIFIFAAWVPYWFK